MPLLLEQPRSEFFLLMHWWMSALFKHIWATRPLPLIKSKHSVCSIDRVAHREGSHILVETASHVAPISEDEGFLHVEPESNDVHNIFFRPGLDFFLGLLEFSEDVLLVVCHHNDQRDIEYILQPPVRLLASHSLRCDYPTYLVNSKGIVWPRCILSLLGPRPVYRKKGSPRS